MQIHFKSPTILSDLFLKFGIGIIDIVRLFIFKIKISEYFILFYCMFLFIGERLQNRGPFHALSSLVSLMALLASQKQERTHLQPFSSTAPLRISWLQRMCHLNPWNYRPYTQKDNTLNVHII
jgi:hypothetical protein